MNKNFNQGDYITIEFISAVDENKSKEEMDLFIKEVCEVAARFDFKLNCWGKSGDVLEVFKGREEILKSFKEDSHG